MMLNRSELKPKTHNLKVITSAQVTETQSMTATDSNNVLTKTATDIMK